MMTWKLGIQRQFILKNMKIPFANYTQTGKL